MRRDRQSHDACMRLPINMFMFFHLTIPEGRARGRVEYLFSELHPILFRCCDEAKCASGGGGEQFIQVAIVSHSLAETKYSSILQSPSPQLPLGIQRVCIYIARNIVACR